MPEPMYSGRKSLARPGRRPRALPSGTVTFLFTDIEGSTRHLREVGAERYAKALADHRRIIRQACADGGGVEVDTQGDAFFVAFGEAAKAVLAAQAIVEAIDDGPMRVRIGLHTGRPLAGEEGYVGEDVHLGARIAAAGHGGQVLMSRATRDAIGEPMEFTDLGEHRLKDIVPPIVLYQIGTEVFPPLKTISNTNLPHPADSFIGREREVADILARVQAGNRLLTLVGPGGTGKTRLAIEAAACLLADFKAGVFWIDLVLVRDPDALAATVTATLTTEQDLAVHIGEREMLLVLDNLEHVIDAAPWVGSLVRACPNLSVMVTSRERMRVRGESLIEVPPLGSTESGRLFADRAGLPSSTDVEELCVRLEHLPLAVELAAARAISLTPRQILDRLGQRLDLLKGGRDADPRQRTLRATIDWSHDLLNADEQRLFRRLSVFVGGTTVEAIEGVCDGDLDILESLIDKSLVRSVDARYTMLETLREYAIERLGASGEEAEIRTRHAAFTTNLMATHIPDLMAGGAETLGRSLTADLGNLQAAFTWLVDSGDAGGAVQLIDTVWWFVGLFVWQGGAGLAMCDAASSMEGLTDADTAILRHREGNFAVGIDPDRARRAWRDAVAIAQRIGDVAREAHVIQNLSLIENDPAEALRLFERSLLLVPPENERAAHRAKWNLVGLKRRVGDTAAANALSIEVHAWAEQARDLQLLVDAELELGEMAVLRGDAPEALERATRARDIGAGLDHALLVLMAESLRCRAAARLGRHNDALAALDSAMRKFGEGDLEAAVELDEMMLRAAVELLAITGEASLASRLESARRSVADSIPWLAPDSQRDHCDLLARTGIAESGDLPAVDVSSALELIREWLTRGQTDATTVTAADPVRGRGR
ncbi:MAG: ATP-binding protein [Candidatus Limnocylindrales bacterium]